MITLRNATGFYKKIHTVKVVAAPAPANTSEITYIQGPVSEFTVNLASSNIILKPEDLLKLNMKFVWSTGNAAGGHSIQFNSDLANNYGTTTQVRTAAGSTPAGSIVFYNSTQPSDTAEFDLWLRTEQGNTSGLGMPQWKTVVGSGWSRNGNSYGSTQYDTISGIWRNSTNNITSIRFFRNSGSSTINIDVGTEIRFYQEQ